MRYVKNITTDAIVLLASVLEDARLIGVKFNGNFPDAPSLKEKFLKSGFLEYLFDAKGFAHDSQIFGLRDIIVKPDLVDEVLEQALATVTGDPTTLNGGLYRTLIEAMTNTHNHADSDSEGVQKWWLLVEHHPDSKKVLFSFVDNGVGILDSINKRDSRIITHRDR